MTEEVDLGDLHPDNREQAIHRLHLWLDVVDTAQGNLADFVEAMGYTTDTVVSESVMAAIDDAHIKLGIMSWLGHRARLKEEDT